METITSKDVKQTFGDTIRRAQQSPIQITSHGRPVAVLMSFENYQMTEEFKMQYLKEKIARAEKDLKEGRYVDGDTFMQELIDGKYD
jgi:prevent-host-death family protein